jgi:hypothetical protein
MMELNVPRGSVFLPVGMGTVRAGGGTFTAHLYVAASLARDCKASFHQHLDAVIWAD